MFFLFFSSPSHMNIEFEAKKETPIETEGKLFSLPENFMTKVKNIFIQLAMLGECLERQQALNWNHVLDDYTLHKNPKSQFELMKFRTSN